MIARGIDSPLGPLTLWGTADGLTRLDWVAGPAPCRGDGTGVLDRAADQLAAYFDGRLTAFDVPFAPQVTAFQARFHAALCAIPFGQTRTYGDLSRDLGVSAQAIGQACGANPLPLFIPCHRVLGACGLGGYSGAGGVETKVWLLRHECGLLI